MKKIKLFREFIENSDNIIDIKMQELKELIDSLSDNSIIYQWENKSDHEVVVNFTYNELSIRYEFDVDQMYVAKFVGDTTDFQTYVESIDEGLDVIEKDIQGILGISEKRKIPNIKYLRKFNEELVTRFPSHRKGEVVVFVNRNVDIGYDTVKDLARKLGYEVTGEIYDNEYIVKTKPGEEESAGAIFVENYPEFFDSYEREDIKDTYICDECDSIISDIEEIRDSVGNLNKYGKSVLSDDWNQNIDEVIKRLEKLKH